MCSTRNVALVRSIGAAHVVDYTTEDFTDGRTHYDVIFDNVSSLPLTRLRGAARRSPTASLAGRCAPDRRPVPPHSVNLRCGRPLLGYL